MAGRHRKRRKRGQDGPRDLEYKVRESGGRTGFGFRDDGNAAIRSTLGNASVSSLSRSRSAAGRSQRTSVTAHIVCAISENLAKETCVASLDASAPIHLQVTKQGNGQTYAETLAYLELLCPHEILLNEGRQGSTLARKIKELYEIPQDKRATEESGEKTGPARSKAVVKFISRAWFDQTKGAELLARTAREDTYDASVVCEYILLSSAHAVLHYTQSNLGATFARKSLDLLVNSGGTNKMVIDRSTLMQLELLANAKSGKTRCSLIATIDYTKTSVGSRLLRTNLMAPPTRIDTITSRLDLVDSFLSNEDFFYGVNEHLSELPCLDQMLSNVALVPPKRSDKKNKNGASDGNGGTEVTKKIARKGISALVGIKSTLGALPKFIEVLEARLNVLDFHQGATGRHQRDQADDASTIKSSLLLGLGGGPESRASELQEHHLLRAIILAMKNPVLNSLLDTISSSLMDSTTCIERSPHALRHEECFALKAEVTSMIHCLRKQYLKNVDDIYAKADEYTGVHGVYVTVRYSTSRGYYLAIPEGTPTPDEFIHPTKNGRFTTCTTAKIVGLNLRAQDNVQDLLIMTDSKIQEILGVARSHYDALAALSDAIAILDMCHSFADCVSKKSARPWCRPMLTSDEEEEEQGGDDSAMVIKNGRYIIEVSSCLTTNDGVQDFVANDTYTTKAKRFTVLTGINGSGKSTYLKQVAIVVIMAHCGAYVPAEFANIPICDRLCTRIGNTDDPEHNISTFLSEMKETGFICRHATPKSLLLIDELGRATSNEDGVALAWAVSERLLQSGALTFFVTHYPQVTLLGHDNMYSGQVQNQHMSASVGTRQGEGGEISYTHKVSSGPCTVSTAYGVDLAYACGWPTDVLGEARTYESHLKEVAGETQLVPDQANQGDGGGEVATTWCKRVASTIPHLQALVKTIGPLDPSAVKRDLRNIKNSFEDSTPDQDKSSIHQFVLDRPTSETASNPTRGTGRPQGGGSLETDGHAGGRQPGQSSQSATRLDASQSSDSSMSDDQSSLSDSSSSSSSDSDSSVSSEAQHRGLMECTRN